MSFLTIVLEDENGNPIQTIFQDLEYSSLLVAHQADFMLLKYVDPYGDTIFNRMQVDDLLQDLDKLRSMSINQAGLIKLIMDLVRECQQDNHTYVKFYGD